MKVNLGCGSDLRPGWLNVDSRQLFPDGSEFLCCDLMELDDKIGDDSVEEMMAQDVLEHVSWRVVDALLVILARKLRPGGILFVQAPNLDRIAKAYLEGTLSHYAAQRYIFGDQGYPENTHMNIWSSDEIVRRLEMVGLKIERVAHVNYNVQAWGRRSQ